jgi:hypothetical protein
VKVHDKLFIGGEWVAPASNAVVEVISPHTEEVIARIPEASAADVDRAVAVARSGFDAGEWPQLAPEERIAAVERFANLYLARLGEMAEIITEEMGSPISFSNLGQAPASWMILNFRHRSAATRHQGLAASSAGKGSSTTSKSRRSSPLRSERGRPASSTTSRCLTLEAEGQLLAFLTLIFSHSWIVAPGKRPRRRCYRHAVGSQSATGIKEVRP